MAWWEAAKAVSLIDSIITIGMLHHSKEIRRKILFFRKYWDERTNRFQATPTGPWNKNFNALTKRFFSTFFKLHVIQTQFFSSVYNLFRLTDRSTNKTTSCLKVNQTKRILFSNPHPLSSGIIWGHTVNLLIYSFFN